MIGVNGVAQARLHHSKLCLLGAFNDLRSRQEAYADKRAAAAEQVEEVLHVCSIC